MTALTDKSNSELRELWDYVTVYGAWDENTPDGTTNGLCEVAMTESRRQTMIAYRAEHARRGLKPRDNEE